jgi:uncharacterized protein
VTQLKARGHITERTLEEEIATAQVICEGFKNRRGSPKKHIFVVTYDCNLRCSYCYERHLRTRGQDWLEETLDVERVDQIFAAIEQFERDISHREMLSIGLYGGEPLLWKNRAVVEYILEQGAEMGYSSTISTNGFRLREFAPLLSKYPIDYVQVTLDGPPEVHNARRFTASGEGTFDRLMQGIKEARKHRIPTRIRTTVDPANAPFVPSLNPHLEALGVSEGGELEAYLAPTSDLWKQYDPHILDSYEGKCSSQMLARPPRRTSRHIESAFAADSTVWIPSGYYCKAENNVFYDPFGDLYTCVQALGCREHTVGTYSPTLDLNENYELWTLRTAFNLPKCQDCRYAPVCGGGCALAAYRANGTIVSGNCGSFKRLLDGCIPYLYRHWKKNELRAHG